MKTGFLALTLALSMLPVAAFAQTAPAVVPDGGRPAMTDSQRQAMFNTFKTIHTQEEALHKQFRTQVLSSLSSLHRQTVANLIGQLAIAANPDESVTVRQLDALLSGAEKTQILNAHNNYVALSRTLHQEAMKQMQQYMPAGAPQPGQHRMNPNGQHQNKVLDPGEILLHTLSSDGMHGGMHGMMPMMGHPPR